MKVFNEALRLNLPDTESNPACLDCAACCQAGMALALSRAASKQMVQAGTALRRIPRGEWGSHYPGRGRRFYELLSVCANLSADGRCMIYEDRPDVCRDFRPNSPECEVAQVRSGRLAVEAMTPFPPVDEATCPSIPPQTPGI